MLPLRPFWIHALVFSGGGLLFALVLVAVSSHALLSKQEARVQAQQALWVADALKHRTHTESLSKLRARSDALALVFSDGKTPFHTTGEAMYVVPPWYPTALAFPTLRYQIDIDPGYKLNYVSDASRPLSIYLPLLAQDAWAFLIIWMMGAIWFWWRLRRYAKSFADVAKQAQAIQDRRFVTLPEPELPELRDIVSALNTSVNSLQRSLTEDKSRLTRLLAHAGDDALTGLLNRQAFLNRLRSLCAKEYGAATTCVVVVRIGNLAKLNQSLGRPKVDEVLHQLARVLLSASSPHLSSLSGRLNGSDFAIAIPDFADGAPFTRDLLGRLQLDVSRIMQIDALHYHLSWTQCLAGEALEHVFARIDGALAAAELAGPNEIRSVKEGAMMTPLMALTDWESLLRTALSTSSFSLVFFPVIHTNERLLHEEGFLRLPHADGKGKYVAAEFLPFAARLDISPELDLISVRLALARIEEANLPVAINLSGALIAQEVFQLRLILLVEQHRAAAAHLWLELPESHLFHHLDAFVALCRRLQTFGVRMGVEHAGLQFGHIGRLHELGLDYMKVDGGFIHDLDQDAGNQAFLQGLLSVAHRLGFQVIAEGVSTKSEFNVLKSLDFDGATGPLITRVLARKSVSTHPS